MQSQCPSGHALSKRQLLAFVCDVCNARSTTNEPSLGCQQCDFDKCAACASVEKGMACPNGHSMTRGVTPTNGFTCDICQATLPTGTATACCRGCNYDVCVGCVIPPSSGQSRSVTIEQEPTTDMTFEALWEYVAKAERDQLPKSALKIVREAIIPKARAANDHAQLLKATIGLAKGAIETEDVGMEVGIDMLEKELDPANRTASFIVTPAEVCFLHSILGEMYDRYLQMVRYTISGRTDLGENVDAGKDIKTWSAAQLERTAFNHYYNSVADPEQLSKEKTSDYNALLTVMFEPWSLNGRARPTLLDFLGHRALSYFSKENNFLSEPSNRFVLRDTRTLGDATVFATQVDLSSNDNTSRKFKALKIYQAMLKIKLEEISSATREVQFPLNLGDASLTMSARTRLANAWHSFVELDVLRISFASNSIKGLAERELNALREKYLLTLLETVDVDVAASAHVRVLFTLGALYHHTIKISPPAAIPVSADTADSKAAGQIDVPDEDADNLVPDYNTAVRYYKEVLSALRRYPKCHDIVEHETTSALNTIMMPSLVVDVESIVPPNAHFMANSKSRNVDGVKYKLYRLTPGEFQTLGEMHQGRRHFIMNLPQSAIVAVGEAGKCAFGVEGSTAFNAIQEKEEGDTVSLEASGDNTIAFVDFNRPPTYHHQRLVEFVLNPINVPGNFVLLTTPTDTEFATSDLLVMNTFKVSQIAVLRNGPQNGFIVCDRQTGVPLKGVKLTLKNNSRRVGFGAIAQPFSNSFDGDISSVSDENGFFNLHTLSRDHSSYTATFQYGDDVLDSVEHYYSNGRDHHDVTPSTNTYFFLDRNIYRPGQTVYFKGLHVESYYSSNITKSKEPKIIPNADIQVTVLDSNYQVIAGMPQKLRTNAFGSFEGSFVTPLTGLTGRMVIQTDGGSAQFRCEEYKRPRFEVSMTTPPQNVIVGGLAKVEGKAVNFSGIPLSGATVKYRVRRVVTTPWFWGFWGRCPSWSGRSAEIHSETVMADENGKFTIDFTAVPDSDINPADKPEFTFEVTVDVSDITGETHSATASMKVGSLALRVDLPLTDSMSLQQLRKLSVGLTDLNGNPVCATAHITLQELVTPFPIGCPFVKRHWPLPQFIAMPKKSFKVCVPQFAYTDEDSSDRWVRAGNEYTRTVTCAGGESCPPSVVTDLAGPSSEVKSNTYYRVVVNAKDSFGTPITVSRTINVFDESDCVSVSISAGSETHFQIPALHFSQSQYRVGDVAVVKYGKRIRFDGTLQPLLVALSTVSQKGALEWDLATAGNHTCQYEDLVQQRAVSIRCGDRGAVLAISAFVAYNRAFTASKTATVPWVEKELSFEYISFRNKLEPGQAEEWRIKVKSADPLANPGDVIAAEVVASLYDASLDKLVGNRPHGFTNAVNHLFPSPAPDMYIHGGNGFCSTGSRNISEDLLRASQYDPTRQMFTGFPDIDWGNFPFRTESARNGMMMRGGFGCAMVACCAAPMARGMEMECNAMPQRMLARGGAMKKAKGGMDVARAADNLASEMDVTNLDNTDGNNNDQDGDDSFAPQIRTNLKETVFFLPTLRTDPDGTIVLRFEMGEALTRWRLVAFAHTKDLKAGVHNDGSIVTQKELMVTPNPPRFLREGDEINFAAKVSNMSSEGKAGGATLELIDSISGRSVNESFGLSSNAFAAFACGPAGSATQSVALSWQVKIPFNSPTSSALTWRIVAKSGRTGDGEESTLPILTNRMMVTESMPMSVRSGQTRTFTLKHFAEQESAATRSRTLSHEAYTVEFTSNPAWYAVQALPYLMEFPHECSEQLFSRYYSNALASHIVARTPAIKRAFELWKMLGSESLNSNLNRNQELKAALLEETPWVLESQSEETQKRQIALLFDLNKMQSERKSAIEKLASRQCHNGGFPWFPGGPMDSFITQHIAAGLAHLQHLGITIDETGISVMKKSQLFSLQKLVEAYELLLQDVEQGRAKLEVQHVSYTQLLFMYTLSFPKAQNTNQGGFASLIDSPSSRAAVDYYFKQASKFWQQFNLYGQGLIALTLHRGVFLQREHSRDSETAMDIISSLRERAIQHEELGAYWKWNNRGFAFYEAPIESHAIMIEVFNEVANDQAFSDELRIWLLKNKQTKHWKTTKQTTEAIYALLLGGDNWLDSDQLAHVTVGGRELPVSNAEPGTGYVKHRYPKEYLNTEPDVASMGTITVSNPNKAPAWGAAYWQYFETLENIKSFEETPLKIKKALYLVVLSQGGEVLMPLKLDSEVTPSNDHAFAVKVGDKVRVRVEVRVDREMSYVHLKDMRASGFEPTNVMSSYKWQDGMGYYECTKDVATHFFISFLPKGTFVFEYTLTASQRGVFSNGVTTMQCMYAPEFTSHSEGVRLSIQ